MKFESKEIDTDLVEITLVGRLDIQGTQAIDMPFTSVTATRRAGVLVDMSGVNFIASIGIRTLLTNAKALAKHGGKMVLLNPAPMVFDVLTTSGVDHMIPINDDYDSAVADLRAALHS
ncbi:MAG: STAS domain-containing protein [Pseudomonadota bacterium]